MPGKSPAGMVWCGHRHPFEPESLWGSKRHIRMPRMPEQKKTLHRLQRSAHTKLFSFDKVWDKFFFALLFCCYISIDAAAAVARFGPRVDDGVSAECCFSCAITAARAEPEWKCILGQTDESVDTHKSAER